MKTTKSTWRTGLKRSFLSGLLLVGPLFATGYVLFLLFRITDDLLQPLLTRSLEAYIPGLGILITGALVLIIGIVTRNLLAQRLIRLGERILNHIPLAGNVYNSIKQILQAFSQEGDTEEKKVVMVPWPSDGLWAFGFLNREVTLDDGRRMALVLLLNSINPTTGILTMVPLEKIRWVEIPVEDAMKLIISGGIVSPRRLQTRPPAAVLP
ncbi:MAG: DUF502 domain-containing protein [Acidobacteria bacterium]|nr:DUF502 domain-containing protein [Acidobacteriota bacterium]